MLSNVRIFALITIMILALVAGVHAQDEGEEITVPEIVLDNGDGIKITLNSISIEENFTDALVPDNGVYIILVAIMVNTSGSRACIETSDFRLVLDGITYRHAFEEMERIAESFNEDYDNNVVLRQTEGVCIGNASASLLATIFDVPAEAETVAFRFFGELIEAEIPWDLSGVEFLSFDDD